MSLILEALKKAERQHQLGEVPSIRPGPAESRSKGMRGLGWIALLLFAAIMLGLGLYLGGFWQKPVDQQAREQEPAMTMPEETQSTVEVKQKPEAIAVEPAIATPPPEATEKV